MVECSTTGNLREPLSTPQTERPPLYYCVLWYVNKDEYATMRRAKCRLIHLFLQRIARPRNTRI